MAEESYDSDEDTLFGYDYDDILWYRLQNH